MKKGAERSNSLPQLKRMCISSSHIAHSMGVPRSSQGAKGPPPRMGPLLLSEADTTQIQSSSNVPWLSKPPNPTDTCAGKWGHLVPGNHNRNTDSSLPPGLLGAKETRKEGQFGKEALSPGGLEQGLMIMTRKVILGGLNTSSNYTESHKKEDISYCEVFSTLYSF